MSITISKSSNTKKEFFFLISILVGYIIVCALPNIFDVVNSRTFSVPYRFIIFFFSIYILSKNLLSRKLDLKIGLLFSVFWFFYFLKILYSFYIDYYLPQFLIQKYEVYLRIFTINLFPCLALLSIDYSKVDFKNLIKYIFWILFIMLTINFLYTLFYLNAFDKVSGIFSVYYISSGHFGASLVFLSFYFLLFKTISTPIIETKILLLAIPIGLFAIYTSAARSPVLVLIVVSLYFIFLKKKIKFLYFFLLFLLVSVILLYISKQIFHIDSAFVERNYGAIFEGNASGRAPYFNRAITIFKDNILIGGRVIYEDGMYPHNIFLELGMAGGVLLMLLFGLIFYPIIKNSRYFLKITYSNFFLLPLFGLWLQYLILTQTSNNIYSNPEFWYFSCVIIGISLKTYNEKT